VPYRNAILFENDPAHPERPARPVGLAIEQDGYVFVEAPDDLCMPTRYERPFTVASPDLTSITYAPRHPQYFDHVLIDLSRAFAIVEKEPVSTAGHTTVLRLLNEYIIRPLRHETRGTWPAIKDYRQRYGYVYDEPAAAPAARHEPAAAPTSSLVAG
jgi:hypothetical protein